jgi:L-malate glycosyltransferase
MIQGGNGWSGGEAVSMLIAQNVPARDNVAFVIPGPQSPEGAGYYAGYTTYPAVTTHWWDVVRAIRSAIVAETPDIVHVHGTRAKWLTALVLGTLTHKPRLLYTIHGFHIAYRTGIAKRIALLIERITSRVVETTICCSQTDYDLTQQYHTAPADRTIVIKNGVLIAPYTGPRSAEVRQSLAWGEDTVVLMVARLHPQKDIYTALSAWKIVQNTRPDVRLVLVGDGPLYGDIKSLCKKYNLEKTVSLLRHRTDVPALTHAADICLLSTRWEGMPLVALEAMAAGKALIATAIPALKEIITDNETGVLTAPNQPDDMAKKILALMEHPQERERIGANAQHYVREHHASAAMVQAYIDCYQTT